MGIDGDGVVAWRVALPQFAWMQSLVEGLACALFVVPCLMLTIRFLLEASYAYRMDTRTLRNAVHIAIAAAIPIAIFITGAVTFGVTAVQLWSQP